MKKLSFALVAAFVLAFAPSAKAELGIGLKAGLALSKVKSEIKSGLEKGFSTLQIDDQFDDGFYIGPTIDFRPLSLNIGVDASLLYSQRGGEELEQQGLEVPINARFYVFDVEKLLSAYVFAGPDFFFNFKDDYKVLKKKASEVGLNLGVGFKLLSHVDLGVNYMIPLGNSFELNDAAGKVLDADFKTRSWQFSLAVTL